MEKLIRRLEYLKGTSKLCLKLKTDSLQVVKWYVDTSFAVNPDFRSHTGAVMTLGEGSIIAMLKKQKLKPGAALKLSLWEQMMPPL